MNNQDILNFRLSNQHITKPIFTNPEEIVEWLGAVQSQDYPAAKWALGLRLKNATDAQIEEAFNEGKILRTHVMRPTWHFVTPADIHWMLELTAPRVKQFMSSYNKKLELTDQVFEKAEKAFAKILEEKTYVTRKELKTELTNIGIKTDVQRLAHLVMNAELNGVICSGPRLGKQFSYALLEKRVPKAKKLTHEESLAKLATKYFLSHGPAQIKDFSWWSGLTIKGATEAVDSIKSKLIHEEIDGKTFWFANSTKINKPKPNTAYLLSIFDEYTISYKDRSGLGDDRYVEKLLSMGNALTSVIILNGLIIGTWKRILNKNTVDIKLNLFKKLSENENEAIEKASENFGKFLELKANIS